MPSIVDLIGDAVISCGAADRGSSSATAVPTGPFGHDGTVPTGPFGHDGTVVGLFFAAGFDEASTAFTPLLADFYEQKQVQLAATDGGGKASGPGARAVRRFEIVYLSSDRDEDGFREFIKEMPWHAVPFASVEIVERNAKRYKIREMPTLVLVEGNTGKLITTSGKECLSEDLDGDEFPWYPKSFDDIISGNLLRQETLIDSKEALDGKIKGVYFSAHWCPPCRIFTPQLVTVYEQLRSEGKNFEIVFVSSDRSQTSFQDYFKTMPWFAIPYKDLRIRHLTKRYQVGGIPTLIILDEQNELVTLNARQAVSKDLEGKEFPWFPPSVNELNESNAACLNESACLILFTDGDEDLIGKAQSLLPSAADQYLSERKTSLETANELPELRFFYEGPESDEIADSIRTFAQLEGRKPLLTIVDIGERRSHTVQGDEISKETINDLISKFKNCTLDFVQLCD